MKTVGGYGRYDDDPETVGCPRARNDMTPCAARDGDLACLDDGSCVGCEQHPAHLLKELVWEVTMPKEGKDMEHDLTMYVDGQQEKVPTKPVSETRWYQTRSPIIQQRVDAWPPEAIYWMGNTGLRVIIASYDEEPDGTCEVCTVLVPSFLNRGRIKGFGMLRINEVPYGLLHKEEDHALGRDEAETEG